MTDDLTTEMEYLMCNHHFYEYLDHNQKDGVNVTLHRASPLARQLEFFPGNYVENSNANSTNVTYFSPLPICSVASVPPVKYQPSIVNDSADTTSSLVNRNYAITTIQALKLCVHPEYMIAINVPYVELTKHRPGAKNNTFSHNFLAWHCGHI